MSSKVFILCGFAFILIAFSQAMGTTQPTIAQNGNSSQIYLPLIQQGQAHWYSVGYTGTEGVSNNSDNSTTSNPSIEIAPDGIVYIIWLDNRDGQSEVYVKQWNGYTWSEVGLGSASDGGISQSYGGVYEVETAISENGDLFIAYKDTIDSRMTYRIRVKKWDGSKWHSVGDHVMIDDGETNIYFLDSIG